MPLKALLTHLRYDSSARHAHHDKDEEASEGDSMCAEEEPHWLQATKPDEKGRKQVSSEEVKRARTTKGNRMRANCTQHAK